MVFMTSLKVCQISAEVNFIKNGVTPRLRSKMELPEKKIVTNIYKSPVAQPAKNLNFQNSRITF